MKPKILAASFCLLSCLLPVKSIAADLTQMYIFGDSLVDTGNSHSFSDLPPSPPYAERLSNGEIWVDFLAAEQDVNPTLYADVLTGTIPTQGINFAFAGATATDIGELIPSLNQQLGFYEEITTLQPPNPDALNIISFAGNDYLQALNLPIDITELPNQVTDNIANGVEFIYNQGGRDFLVLNMPDISQTPFANNLALVVPGSGEQLQNLTIAHNFLLEEKLADLNSLPDINIDVLDVYSLFNNVIANPEEFGFQNTSNSCLINFRTGFIFDGVCENPDEFWFGDDVHPTTAAHEVIGDLALGNLGEAGDTTVPEPTSTFAILALGLLATSRGSRG